MEEKKNEETVVLTKEEYEDLKRSVKTINYTAMFNAGQQARISQLEERLEHAYELLRGKIVKEKKIEEELYKKGYRKIPEGAVVLTREELEERIDCCNVAMIHHDEDGKRYIEYEKYRDFTNRLGDRIQQLKGLLKREHEETVKRFADLVEFHSVSTRDEDGHETFTISVLCLKEILREEFGVED